MEANDPVAFFYPMKSANPIKKRYASLHSSKYASYFSMK
jgi:hypothetical protein